MKGRFINTADNATLREIATNLVERTQDLSAIDPKLANKANKLCLFMFDMLKPKTVDDKLTVAMIYKELSANYHDLGNNEKSLKKLLKAISQFQELPESAELNHFNEHQFLTVYLHALALCVDLNKMDTADSLKKEMDTKLEKLSVEKRDCLITSLDKNFREFYKEINDESPTDSPSLSP